MHSLTGFHDTVDFTNRAFRMSPHHQRVCQLQRRKSSHHSIPAFPNLSTSFHWFLKVIIFTLSFPWSLVKGTLVVQCPYIPSSNPWFVFCGEHLSLLSSSFLAAFTGARHKWFVEISYHCLKQEQEQEHTPGNASINHRLRQTGEEKLQKGQTSVSRKLSKWSRSSCKDR